MTIQCSFILPTGRKCRCAATRNQTLCRHHAPKPAVPGPPPLPKRERYSRIQRWRELGRNLPWMPLDEIPYAVHNILDCLVYRQPDQSPGEISDLAAGRYLRALLSRLGHVPFPHPDDAQQPAAFAPPSSFVPPLAPDLQAALAALPGPGHKPDKQAADALIAAFANNGLLPPHVLAGFRSSRS